jgi:flagellar P-ring protein FlgI
MWSGPSKPMDGRAMEGRNVTGRIIAGSVVLVLMGAIMAGHAWAVRIKDLVSIQGIRANQLVGYGLVVGLNGTGDKNTTYFTNQAIANMLEKIGIRIDPTKTKVNNVAAVMVTTNLPAFAKAGTKIDATVSSMGDAKSIEGGVLLLTPLKGADGEVYAVAQGSLVVGGFLVGGQAASVQKNHPTVGKVPGGVTVEREVPYDPFQAESLVLSLALPDFTNAKRVAESINGKFSGVARARDAVNIELSIPEVFRQNPVQFLAAVEGIDVQTDAKARVVVDEKTGTVVIGENVSISTVAVSHGNITVQVKEEQKVSQPLPFARGQTVVSPDTQIRVEEEKGRLVLVPGTVSIKELVGALNAIGVSSRDMITILQTIKAAGALHAELEVL